MARINAYPFITTIADSDAWIGTKASDGATKQFTAADVAAYVNSTITGPVTGSGTVDTMAVFKTAKELYTPANTTAITGKSFVQKISQTNATIELGATDATFTTLTEGIKIFPNTTHYTTRVLPWLEVYPYQDPTSGNENAYGTDFAGACFIVGKQNTVDNATADRIGIVGSGMTVLGQSSLFVGTLHTTAAITGGGSGQPVTNSLLVGSNHATDGKHTNAAIFGTSNRVFGVSSGLNLTQNSFIAGQANYIYDMNHSAICGGNLNRIGNAAIGASNNNTNFIGAGYNNKIGTQAGGNQNASSFILGRNNDVNGVVGGAIGTSNTVYSASTGGTSIAIGGQNSVGGTTAFVRNAIAIGYQNNIDADYTIHIGRGLDEVATAGTEYVLVGRQNDQNTDYSLAALDVSFVVGASTLTAAASRRNALVITNKTAASNESNVILPGVGEYRNYASEALAIAGGVPLYGLYRNGDDIKIRITP